MGIFESITDIWNELESKVQSLINSSLSSVWSLLSSAIVTANTAYQKASSLSDYVYTTLVNRVDGLASTVVGIPFEIAKAITTAKNYALELVNSALATTKSWVESSISYASELVSTALATTRKWVDDAIAHAAALVNNALTTARGWVDNAIAYGISVVKKSEELLKGIIAETKQRLEEAITDAITFLTTMIYEVESILKAALDALEKAIWNAINAIIEKLDMIWATLFDPDAWYQWMEEMIEAVW
jgi:hypothetical protein